MKRILSIFLAVVFAISIARIASAAEEAGSKATPEPEHRHHKGVSPHHHGQPAPKATPAPAPETK